MAFSGALTLTDLNDYITPAQACIKPVEQTNRIEQDPGAASTQIHIDSSGSYYEVSTDTKSVATTVKKLEQAQISLNDCLACSGCITSAESVLITMQSHTEVLNFLSSNPSPLCSSHKSPVLSIAPQSLASLATSVSSTSSAPTTTLHQILRRVQAFCTSVLGFDHVFDTTFARHIVLLEHTQEFMERRSGDNSDGGKLPMLASACPGWVCYAEKTHSEMLPFISRTKSPQQVMGTLVKNWMGRNWGKKLSEIYHVTVMPCYDKKLEASRQDFYSELYSTRDVDCVITTGELELLMREKGWDLSIPVPGEEGEVSPSIYPSSPPPPLYPGSADLHPPRGGETFGLNGEEPPAHTSSAVQIPELLSHPGTSSGSYLHSIISALTLSHPFPLELSTRTVRGADYEEYVLTNPETGEVVFKGAKCYGFRNLQNVVRKVGREAGVQVGRGAAGRMVGGRVRKVGQKGGVNGVNGERERGYDYVEVMACPGGCVNGGGQLRPSVRAQVEKKTDEEGYERDWSGSGVKVGVGMDDGETNVQGYAGKWGDKDWTKKVESAYWHDLPTPPASPALESSEVKINGHGRSTREADRYAAIVLRDLCEPEILSGGEGLTWETHMGAIAEEKRRLHFRTQYRAVEGEVIGLAVKW
ncbi:hypothetical protein JAAARDRAFT_39165 [Jaapia argillacea MUCL 33604]|uniref:Iron hydrogenase large subunit C-terminal domain-containing protein n=1 Tax=Jaapia argillacea MUCL 33604 TaxID=933084 RepID=A0A067PT18_9AGAM|nr:hypothetical protein JAAARDRAFT_39165 [Jaapia argillacea MUCL 33604]